MRSFYLYLLSFGLLMTVSCATENSSDTENKDKPITTNIADKNATAKNKLADTNQKKGKIDWITNLADLETKNKKEPRKVLVDLYTSWCGWCKRMDRDTFEHPEIANYVNENFYAVKFNAETKETIPFQGKDYKLLPQGRRGTNEWALKVMLGDKKQGRTGYPTIAFLDEQLERIDAFPGYKDANKFDVLAHFIKEEHYEKMSYNQFMGQYKSPIPPKKPQKNTRKPIKINPNQINKQNLQPLKIEPRKKPTSPIKIEKKES